MVEVIVGFVILVMVLAECMVHLLGVSGELVKKSKDMQEEQRILNEEMYRTDTVFETLADTGITLTVDTNKTDSQNMPQATSFAIEAVSYTHLTLPTKLEV